MAAFDRIFADTRKDIPSVVDAVLRQEVFRVLDDFTQRTNIWQEHVAIKVEPHVVDYPFVTLEGRPNRLMTVYEEQGPQMGPLIWPPPPRVNYPSNPTMWPGGPMSMRIPGVLHLPRDINVDAVWRAVIAKRTADPVDTQTKYPVIDEWIVDKYADTIGRGILARLQWEPQKPYSNPMLAAQNQRAYIGGCALARINDGHANIFDGANWRFPQQFATVNRKGFV